MKLLAVSTSDKSPSAAVLTEDGRVIEGIDESGRAHSVSLASLVEDTLDRAGLSVSDMDAFAVDVGPGSFTGVRIGVSFVNALAYATGKPVFAVTSLHALRRLARGEGSERVCALLDARNGNGYAAVFDGESCIEPPCACVVEELVSALPADTVFVGSAMGRSDSVRAGLVIEEARRMSERDAVSTATPLYLRPSQAERIAAERGGA